MAQTAASTSTTTLEDGFKPYYIVDGNKKKTVSELKSALKKADTLYLATDEDREGEETQTEPLLPLRDIWVQTIK